MIINILLWTIGSIFVGIVGYLMETNLHKSLSGNIIAAFVGFFPVAILTHFILFPAPEGELNVVATFVGMICGYIAVNLEDNLFLKVK